jgi:probable rRNA maturation factor
MIEFHYETAFELEEMERYRAWLIQILESENKTLGSINYVFCDDDYLLRINQQYLLHDEYTDIISFDYCIGNEVNGDIFISVERVKENATQYRESFTKELQRVMAHGVLHYCGYQDKLAQDRAVMRAKEDEKIGLF